MRRPNREQGFSLVEALVSTVLTLLLMGLLVEVQFASQRLANKTMSLGGLEEAASRAVTRVGAELRWAQPDSLVISPENGSDRVDMRVAVGYDGTATVWSTPIAFMYEPSALDTDGNGVADEGVLVRLQDGGRRVVCRNVEAGSFRITRNGDMAQIGLRVICLTEDSERLSGSVSVDTAFLNPEDV